MSVPLPYAVSACAIAATLAFAVTHELLPAEAPASSVAVEQPKVEPPASHPVRTISIVASPLVAPAIPAVVPPPVDLGATVSQVETETFPASLKKAAKNITRNITGDVCAHHGGQRVDDAARRSWHCVFPKRAAR
jgi:hypothetical protein